MHQRDSTLVPKLLFGKILIIEGTGEVQEEVGNI